MPPPPSSSRPRRVDVPASAGLQTAVLAGGCFWGMEGVFEHVKGVTRCRLGLRRRRGRRCHLCQGQHRTHRPCRGDPHHLRPRPGQLRHLAAHLFLGRARSDPAQPPGSRHRPQLSLGDLSPVRRPGARVANAYIKQLAAARAFGKPIVTRLELGKFFAAERSHQDFMRRNPMNPYILANDVEKVTALKRVMPNLYRS